MNQRVGTDHLWVMGKSAPGSTVVIYVNGKEVARVVAAENGVFAVMVPLQPGKNTVQARAELGGETTWSDTVTIYYVERSAQLTVDDTWKRQAAFLSVALFFVIVGWLFYRHYEWRKEKKR
jgi:hypothetical protein